MAKINYKKDGFILLYGLIILIFFGVVGIRMLVASNRALCCANACNSRVEKLKNIMAEHCKKLVDAPEGICSTQWGRMEVVTPVVFVNNKKEICFDKTIIRRIPK